MIFAATALGAIILSGSSARAQPPASEGGPGSTLGLPPGAVGTAPTSPPATDVLAPGASGRVPLSSLGKKSDEREVPVGMDRSAPQPDATVAPR